MNLAKHWAATLDDYVIDLAWSPDGSMLAAASTAGGITLFDADTGAVRHSLAGHASGANCLAWLPQGEPGGQLQPSALSPSAFSGLLASGGQDGCVRIWNPVNGTQIAEAKLGSAWVEHLAWCGTGLPTRDSAERSASNLPPSASLLFAAAGKKLVALSSAGSTLHSLPDAPKVISALAATPPNNQQPLANNPPAPTVASACFGRVAVYDAATFALRKEYAYGNAIYALTWSPDGRWLVAGCHDNAVHLWAPAEDVELHMSGYETRLKELSFSHDGRWLATGGGRDACVWDCSGPGPEGREPLLLPHNARVCAVAFQHAHSFLATGDTRGVFTLWAPTRKNPMFAEVTMPAAATKFAWRADDSRLAVGTEQGQVFVFRTD